MLEDPRTFIHNGHVYLYHVESSASFLYNCYTVFGVLDKEGGLQDQLVLAYKKNMLSFNAISRLGWSDEQKLLPIKEWQVDKNWQFFIQDGKYYCIYEAGQKQEVFCFDFPAGTITEKYITYNNLNWKFGRISGGAAPVLHGDGYYYCFFHSWNEWINPPEKRNWLQRKYHMGVYTFESKPPFRIKKISLSPFLSGNNTDMIAASGHSVVFPGSAFFEETTGEWVIAIGCNDYTSKVVRINHNDIIENMVPVTKRLPFIVINRGFISVVKKIRLIAGRLYRAVK